jgi:hypothetical protein
MLIEIYQIQIGYSRQSKYGTVHTYSRNRKIAVLQCDCCMTRFERRVSNMDHRRLTVNHTHVCENCQPKKFAQNKAVESRNFWNTTVDLDIDLDSFQ